MANACKRFLRDGILTIPFYGWRVALGLLVVACLGLLTTRAVAQEDPARDALRGGAYPWYNKEADGVRKIELLPQAVDDFEPPNRKLSYFPKIRTIPPGGGGPTGPRGSFLGPLLNVIGYMALFAVCAVLIWMVGNRFLRREITESKATKVVETSRKVDQVQKLPMQLASHEGDFLSMARSLMAQGNYGQAIIYLYAHQLVSLDERHLIRLSKGKTNRQYLRELRKQAPVASLVEGTITLFEDAFFGKKLITEAQFLVCWNQLDQFESLTKALAKAEAA